MYSLSSLVLRCVYVQKEASSWFYDSTSAYASMLDKFFMSRNKLSKTL